MCPESPLTHISVPGSVHRVRRHHMWRCSLCNECLRLLVAQAIQRPHQWAWAFWQYSMFLFSTQFHSQRASRHFCALATSAMVSFLTTSSLSCVRVFPFCVQHCFQLAGCLGYALFTSLHNLANSMSGSIFLLCMRRSGRSTHVGHRRAIM